MESISLDRDVPTLFGDSAWTIANPSLREELKRRIGSWSSRTRSSCPDRSDVVQEVLNVALRNRLLLRQLTAPQRSSWFWVVVSRFAARFTSRRSRVTPLSAFAERLTPLEIHDTRIEEPAAALERLERAAVVRDALRQLPSTWQEVLSLRNAHPGDWRPIADALGTTPGAARALWYRALEGLRERLLQNDCFRDGSI